MFLAPLKIGGVAVVCVECSPCPVFEHTIEEASVRNPTRPSSARDPSSQPCHDAASVSGEVRLGEMRRENADATADVEPHPTGRDDTAVVHVGCCDTTDGEPVSPMDVRHGVRGADDPGKMGHVRYLVESAVLSRLCDECLVCKHDAWDAHPTGARDLPPIRVTTLQLHDPIIPHRGRSR